MYGGSEFQNNNIKKHPCHIYFLKNSLSRNLLLIRLIIITVLELLPKDLPKTHYSSTYNPLVSANQSPTIMITQK